MYRRIFVFILLAFFLLALPLSISDRFRNGAARDLSPITLFFQRQRQGISTFFADLGQIGELRSDKENLQKQVTALQQQVSDYDSLKRENTALQQELGVTGTASQLPKVLGHVIVQGSDPLDRTFTIDVGSAQGIKVGQPVISGGYLVGRITDVRSQSAQVRSIFSSQSIVQAWIPSINDKGLLIGEDNTVSLQKITQGITVPANSLVETSGLGGTSSNEIPLPQGLLIGTTSNNLSKASDPTQSFQVTITQDPNSLETVMVLLTSTS